MTINAKLIVSAKDGSTGYLDTDDKRDNRRVYHVEDNGSLSYCHEQEFHRDGANARTYGLMYRTASDLIVS